MIIQDLRAFSNGVRKTALPVLVFVLILFVNPFQKAFAQIDSNRIDFHKGSFFDFYIGENYNNSYDLSTTLALSRMWQPLDNKPISAISPKFKNQRFGESVGFSGFYGMDRGVLIGGSFNYTYLGSNANIYAKQTLNMLNFSFNMGKVVYNFNNILMHFYVGVGFSEYLMRITNKDGVIPIKFNALPDGQLLPHNKANYHATIPVIEVGYGVRCRIKDKVNMGITGGIYFSSITQGNWATGGIMSFGQVIDAREAPTMSGCFIRLSVELWRKGSKLYAGPRAFRFDSIAYKRQLFVEDSTTKAEAAAKKGVVFENKYKRDLEMQDSIRDSKGFLARIKPVASYDTSAAAKNNGKGAVSNEVMPQPAIASGPAARFIPVTTNVVSLGTNAKKGSLASARGNKNKKALAEVNSQSFNFNRVLGGNKADTSHNKAVVKAVSKDLVDSSKTVGVKDTSAEKNVSTASKQLKRGLKTRSTREVVDSLIRLTAARAAGKDTVFHKEQKPIAVKGKQAVTKDTLVIKKQQKLKPIPTAADSAKTKVKVAADLKKRSDILKKLKKDSLLRLVKQSQVELEEKYRRGLIKNDSTNKVVKLIHESRKKAPENEQQDSVRKTVAPVADTTSTKSKKPVIKKK